MAKKWSTLVRNAGDRLFYIGRHSEDAKFPIDGWDVLCFDYSTTKLLERDMDYINPTDGQCAILFRRSNWPANKFEIVMEYDTDNGWPKSKVEEPK